MGMRNLSVDNAEQVNRRRLFSAPFAGDRRPEVKTPTGWLFGKHPSLQSFLLRVSAYR
jgi:hypothetical protein